MSLELAKEESITAEDEEFHDADVNCDDDGFDDPEEIADDEPPVDPVDPPPDDERDVRDVPNELCEVDWEFPLLLSRSVTLTSPPPEWSCSGSSQRSS